MLIKKTYHDVPSALDNGKPIRVFVIAPQVPGYPQAKFPGRPIYPEASSSSRKSLICPGLQGVVCFSEIYQVTGPVERFAGQIASQGYVVGGSRHQASGATHNVEWDAIDLGSACPSTYHEFEGPEPIPYDTEGKSAASPLSPVES
jgi:carboxymethylenebutenolidase